LNVADFKILEVISRILVGITVKQVVNPIDARVSY